MMYSLEMWIATFRLLTASLLQAIRSTDCPASSCSLSGPLLYRSPVVVFFDRGHPCFRIKKHNNRRTVQQRTTEGTATCWNNGTIGGSKCTNHRQPLWYKWYRAISRPYHLKKTSNKQLKRRDLHLKRQHRETNNNTLYYCIYHDEWQQPFPWHPKRYFDSQK